jgi:hypothetical protein
METRVYKEFGEPNDFLDSIGVTLLKNPARFASLSIARSIKAGFSGERELTIMRLLRPIQPTICPRPHPTILG